MNPFLALLLRQALTALGTMLVAKGVIPHEQLDAWVSANLNVVLGAGTIGLSVALSVLDKIKNSIFHLNGAPKSLTKIEDVVLKSVDKK